MAYAIAYINSVEYGPSWRKTKHYSWDKKSRAKSNEKQLAKALDEAYQAGSKQVINDMKDFLEGEE